jgi:DNA-3-methyladenine glycosylase II
MTKIRNHFKTVDPILFAAMNGDSWSTLKRNHDHFTGLCRIIVGQQVSTKAARAIFERYCGLFPRKQPTLKRVLALTDVELQSAGLSRSKALSIRDLAERAASKAVDLKKIDALEDDAIKEMLISVRGIGPWSAEMFLIFYLGREDVFSPGDYGLRVAIQKLYKKRRLPSQEEAARFARRWSPYRSYACRILWESLNNTPTK